MEPLVASLLRIAVLWTGMPDPEAMPPVEVLARAEMPCACMGFFAYARSETGYGVAMDVPARLILREDVDLGTVYGRGILLHELVHLLQAQAGPAAYGTSTWYAREREAYRVQYRYLREHGSPVIPIGAMSARDD